MAGPLVKPIADKLPLNEKQKRFALEYVLDLNATQAAIRSGYSKRSAGEQASRLLRDVRIQKVVQEEKDARARRTEVSVDRVLEEYARIAYQDHRIFYNSDGSLKKIRELDDTAAAILSGSEVAETFQEGATGPTRVLTSKIRTWSKDKALDALSKHLGIFEKHNLQQQVNIFPPEINKPEDSGQ